MVTFSMLWLVSLVSSSPRRLKCGKSQGQIVVCLFQEHFQDLPREGKSFISHLFVSLLRSSTVCHLKPKTIFLRPPIPHRTEPGPSASLCVDCRDERMCDPV